MDQSSNFNIEVVIAHRSLLGEGPVWDTRRRSINWVDILNGEIHEYFPDEGLFRTIAAGQMVGTVAICKNGHYLAALQNGFGFIDRETGKLTMINDPEQHLPLNRFNDGKCDPQGRFWAGTMSTKEEPGAGSLYLFDIDHAVTKKVESVTISNGMAWSLDQKTFYYIDTPTFCIVSYNYDSATGNISNKKTIIEVAEHDHNPDGMTIDNEGMLWIAHWGGYQLTRWDPNTGTKLLSVKLPVSRVTSCTFGGDDLTDLYITSARVGLTEDELLKQPLAGSLFVIRNCGFKGLPFFEFDDKSK